MGDCNSFILSGLWGIDGRVLIVPSGIETPVLNFHCLLYLLVLIVPSGIETWFQDRPHTYRCFVLIVPSGIETNIVAQNSIRQVVLIVPSGIETTKFG